MSITQSPSPLSTIKCANCGREIPALRPFCPYCGRRVRPRDTPDLNGQPVPSDEVQQLKASLEAAQNENQLLRRQFDSTQEELKQFKTASPKSEPSAGFISELHTKLKSAEERAATLESHSAEWEKKWKSAEEKAALFEKKAVANATAIEPVISRRLKMIAGLVAVVSGLGGYGAGHYAQPGDNSKTRVGQLLNELAQAQRQIGQLKSSLDSANKKADQVTNDSKSQMDSTNQRLGDLTNKVTASNAQRSVLERNLASTKRDLASAQTQLEAAVNKERSGQATIEQQQSQLAAANQRVQQLEGNIKSLNDEIARLRARPPNIANPNAAALVWSGVLAGKRRIEIKDGVANYGTIRSGALPGKPCRVTTPDPNVQFKTVPAEKNHWNRVAFDVSGTGVIQVRINCISQ
jgi:phage shock protein A